MMHGRESVAIALIRILPLLTLLHLTVVRANPWPKAAFVSSLK